MPSVWSLAEEFRGTERFEVLGRIGAGGMGVVYEAIDRTHGGRVALKMLRQLEPDTLLRFKQEFRALADVNHVNLVGLRELVCEGDHWFVTMELIDGVDFLRWVRPGETRHFEDTLTSSPPAASAPGAYGSDPSTGDSTFVTSAAPARSAVELPRLRAALHQLATGVSALHQLGKLHCDLKPANVLVTPAGRVVLLDFGLLTDLDLDPRPRGESIVGTAGYMAPEQGAAAALTEASDWYAVGSMLYEALTGRLPFMGSTVQMLMAKRQLDPPRPRTLAPDAPEDLDALCMDLLRRDPADRPTGHDVLRRLGVNAGIVSALARPERTPLVGRRAEREILDAALARTAAGTPACVLVHGRSGMGKSTLVRRFLHDVTDHALVLAGRCYERESVPYKALDSVIDALARHLSRLPAAELAALLPRDAAALVRVFPVLSRVSALAAPESTAAPPASPDATELRRRAFLALRQLLAALAARRPTVLFIDDLQWADADSAVFLADLLAPPDPPALLLVGCHRDEAEAPLPLYATLLGARQGVETRELAIGALADAEARTLARALLGETDERSERAAREAQGSPFLLVQLAQHLQSGAGLASSTGEVRFEDLMRARLEALPERERLLLEVVAVAGRPLAKEVARGAAELGALDDALAPLCAGQLLRTSRAHGHASVECYHDRIRETVVALLAPTRVRAHHAALARTLEAEGGADDPEALALHYDAAGEPERAGSWAVVAADRAAAALAFDHAAGLYRRALASRRLSADERRELHARLGAALAGAGRGHESALAYLVAADGASPEQLLERRQCAAQQYLRAGYVDEGEAVLEQVLAQVGVRSPPTSPAGQLAGILFHRARIRLRGYHFRERAAADVPADELVRLDTLWSVATGLGVIDFLRPVYFNQLHLVAALRLGEPTRVGMAFALEASMLVAQGGGPPAERAARLIERAHELAERSGDARARATTDLLHGSMELQLGHFAASLPLFDAALELLRERCSNVSWEINTALLLGGTAVAMLGHLAELQRRLPLILREGAEHGDLYLSTSAPAFLHQAWLASDEPNTLRREVRDAMRRWTPRGYMVQNHAQLTAEVAADLYDGDGESAWRRARSDWPRLGVLLRSFLARVGAHSVMGRAAIGAAVGRGRGEALVAAQRAARALERDRMPYPAAQALLVRGGIAAMRDERAAAADCYGRAVSAFTAIDMRVHAAAARRRLGQLTSTRLVDEADAIFAAERIKRPDRFAAMLAPAPVLD